MYLVQPRAGEVLGKSFKDFYGNLEKVLVANLIWSLSLIPVISVLMIKGFSVGLFLLPFVGISILLLSLTTAGTFSYMKKVAKGESVEYMDIWKEGKKYFKESLIILAMYGGVGFLTFFVVIGFKGSGFFLSFLQGVGIWAFLFFSLIGTYIFPLMISENLEIWKIIKEATALTLDNFWFTLIISVVVLLIFVLSTIVVVGVFLFLISLMGIIQNNAYLSIRERFYGSGDL